MEKRNSIKISLSTVLLLIAIVVIIIMGIMLNKNGINIFNKKEAIDESNLQFAYYETEEIDSFRYALLIGTKNQGKSGEGFLLQAINDKEFPYTNGYVDIKDNQLILRWGPFSDDRVYNQLENVFNKLGLDNFEENENKARYVAIDYSDPSTIVIGNVTFKKVN